MIRSIIKRIKYLTLSPVKLLTVLVTDGILSALALTTVFCHL